MNPPAARVSVVIPTHRRPAAVGRCLEALASLDHPAERLQVVVVDDGGGIPLTPTLAPFEDRLSVTLLEQARAGPAAARNAGARRATGELIAFTDDDCRPRPGWLAALARHHAEAPQDGLGGRTANGLPQNPYSEASELVIAVGYTQNARAPERPAFFASNNMAFPRDGFEEVGGFDERFRTAEDRDICARWGAAGRRMAYVPEAVVDHAHDLTLGGFWRQQFAYGRGACRYHRAESRRSGRVRPEPAFYAALLGAAASACRRRRSPVPLALLATWGAATTAGFLAEARSR